MSKTYYLEINETDENGKNVNQRRCRDLTLEELEEIIEKEPRSKK